MTVSGRPYWGGGGACDWDSLNMSWPWADVFWVYSAENVSSHGCNYWEDRVSVNLERWTPQERAETRKDTLESLSKITLRKGTDWVGLLVFKQCFGTSKAGQKGTLWAKQGHWSGYRKGTQEGPRRMCPGIVRIFMVTILLILLRGQSLIVCFWILGFVLRFT